jgi:phage-related minor tail protein
VELDEILNEKAPDTPEAPEAPAVETEAPKPDLGARQAFKEKEQAAQEAGRARAPDGKFVATEPKTEEPKAVEPPKPETPAPQVMSPKEQALLRAAQDERTKRQALEQEIAQLRAAQKPAEPQKTFYEDPDGVLAQVEQRIAQQSQQMQHTTLQNRVQFAEMLARKEHPDFDAMVPIFGELLQTTPGLYQQWINAPDPAGFAYTTAKNTLQLRQAGSIDAIREEAVKKARLELEAEYKEREAKLLKQRDDIPDSLSDKRSTSTRQVAWGGPPSLDAILSK